MKRSGDRKAKLNSKRRSRYNSAKTQSIVVTRDNDQAVPTGTACPRPDKARYLSRREAKGRNKGLAFEVNAYQCDCGFWHVGHASEIVKVKKRGAA